MAKKSIQLEFKFDVEASDSDEILQLLSPDDIYRRAEVLANLLTEDRRVERKGVLVNPKDLGRYLSMWANTSPDGGILVIGINDKTGEIEGCKGIDSRRLNDFEQMGIDTCPDAVYDSRRVPIVNSKGESDFVLVVRVYYHATKAIETSDRKLYVRRGDRCKELKNDDERRQLRIDKGEVGMLESARIERARLRSLLSTSPAFLDRQ